MIEKLINKKIISNNNILYKYQFGFQPKLSTILALVEIVHKIRNAIYGIRGHCHQLLISCLSGRAQFTYKNSTKSTTQEVEYGVSQGYFLRPLLFLIYVNNLQYASDEHLRMFVNDTNIFISDKDIQVIKERAITALKEMNKRFSTTKLILNMSNGIIHIHMGYI